jgi:hypothetical protein
MSLLPVFLKLDGRFGLPGGAGAPGKFSSALRPSAADAQTGIPEEKVSNHSQLAPPDEGNRP